MIFASSPGIRYLPLAVLLLFFAAGSFGATPASPEAYLEELDSFPHARRVSFDTQEVIDHEIGLGGIRKVRGDWRFKDSERLSGTLVSYTWQIMDGFTSAQVMDKLLAPVAANADAQLLFKCEGRACGHSAQWANRVFAERVLYGREDWQQYAVYALQDNGEYRLVVYSAARTEDRQYLRADLLRIAD